jgi:hypothetical protein
MSLLSEEPVADDEPSTATTEASAAETEAPKEEPGTRVTLKPSRREQARLAAEETARKEQERDAKFQAEFARRDQEIAMLRGEISARLSQPQVIQQQAPTAPAGPDPAELRRQARQALDNKDFSEYERLSELATIERVKREFEPRFAQVQAPAQQQQGGMSPQAMAWAAQYPDVMTHQNGLQLAIIEDAKLHHMGHQPGPARFKAAFEAARATITGGQKPAAPQYSQQSAAVLSGVPTSRSPAGGGGEGQGPGVVLTPQEKDIARKAGMSLDEFAKDIYDHHPERRVG